MSRRRWQTKRATLKQLGIVATAGLTGLAGCSGGGGDSTATPTESGDTQTPVATDTSVDQSTPASSGSGKLGFEGVMSRVPVPTDFDSSFIRGVLYLDADQDDASQLPNVGIPYENVSEVAYGDDWAFISGPENALWSELQQTGYEEVEDFDTDPLTVFESDGSYLIDLGDGEYVGIDGQENFYDFAEGLMEDHFYADVIGESGMEAVRRADESPGGAERFDRSERDEHNLVGSMSLQVGDGRVERDTHAKSLIEDGNWYFLEYEGDTEDAPFTGGTPFSVYDTAINEGEQVQ